MQSRTAPWPSLRIPGSPANYWQLDYDSINNMQWTVTPKDSRIPIFPDPHCCVTGTVVEVISEPDGDHHIWINLDGTTKGRFACEIVPQNAIAPPAVGQHVRIYGIFRYDLQHSVAGPRPSGVGSFLTTPGAGPEAERDPGACRARHHSAEP
jgi:hypothetical protein